MILVKSLIVAFANMRESEGENLVKRKPLAPLLRWATLLTLCWCLAFPTSALAVRIVVDPGHGGKDPGAIGVNGLYEKTVNRDVSLKLKAELERLGYEVLLTADTDIHMSLPERVAFKEAAQADLFISIHANAHHSSAIQGSMVLYYDRNYPQASYPASAEMAELTPLSKQLATYVAESMAAKAGTYDRGIVPSAVYVARHGTIPSILVETAFLSNPKDAANLASDAFRTQLALGIAEGIQRFLPSGSFADISGHWAMTAINRMKERGIVHGNNSRFQPDRSLTRVEFLAMADRLFHFSNANDEQEVGKESPEPSTVTDMVYGDSIDSPELSDSLDATPIYTDMTSDHWGYDVMQQATEQRIIQGYGDGTVRPDEPITRAEVASIFDRIWSNTLRRSNTVTISSASPTFIDVSDSTWYTGSVYRLVRANLLQGTGEGRFEPERSMSRAEAAVLFDRYDSRQQP